MPDSLSRAPSADTAPKKAARDDASMRTSIIVCYLGTSKASPLHVAVLLKETRPWGTPKGTAEKNIWGLSNAKVDCSDKDKLGKHKKHYSVREQRRIARAAAVRELPEETGLYVDGKTIKLRYIGKEKLPKELSKRGNRFIYAAFVAGTSRQFPITLSPEHTAWKTIPHDQLAAFLASPRNCPDAVRTDHYGKVVRHYLDFMKKKGRRILKKRPKPKAAKPKSLKPAA